jgi:cytochrome c oxidase subunit IV
VGSGTLLWGLLTLAAGIAFAAAALALWSVQPWAWMFAVIMAGLGVIDAFFLWLATGDFAYGFMASLLPLLVLWYLNQKDIKGVFGIDTDTSP